MTQEKPSERQREIEREQRAHDRAMERERERIERERERERQMERERREVIQMDCVGYIYFFILVSISYFKSYVIWSKQNHIIIILTIILQLIKVAGLSSACTC
jgi:hypothetical protein